MNVKRLVVAAATAILAVVGITAVRATDEAASRGSGGNGQSGDVASDGRGPTTPTAVVPGHVRVSLEIAVSVLSRALAGVLGLERTGGEASETAANGACETTTVTSRRE